MTDKKQILGTSKSEDDSLVTAKQQSNSETDEMPKVFLVKEGKFMIIETGYFPIELTPSDLELIKFDEQEVMKFFSPIQEGFKARQNLLKKLSDLKC